MRVPKLNLKKAIIAYYTLPDLSNADIRDLYDGEIGARAVNAMKKGAMKINLTSKRPIFHDYCVSTEDLFEAIGLTIEELEQKYKRLQKLKLLEEVAVCE